MKNNYHFAFNEQSGVDILLQCLAVPFPHMLNQLREITQQCLISGAHLFEVIVGTPVQRYGVRLTFEPGNNFEVCDLKSSKKAIFRYSSPVCHLNHPGALISASHRFAANGNRIHR